MAEALVKAGVRVAITGRNRSRADAIAEQLGLSATGVELDVRDEASVQSGVEEAYTQLGVVDVLVNNAGVGMRTVNPRFMTRPQPFWEVSPAGFRDVMEPRRSVASFSPAPSSPECWKPVTGVS